MLQSHAPSLKRVRDQTRWYVEGRGTTRSTLGSNRRRAYKAHDFDRPCTCVNATSGSGVTYSPETLIGSNRRFRNAIGISVFLQMSPHSERGQDETEVEATPSGVDQRVNPHRQSGVYNGFTFQLDLPLKGFSVDCSTRVVCILPHKPYHVHNPRRRVSDSGFFRLHADERRDFPILDKAPRFFNDRLSLGSISPDGPDVEYSKSWLSGFSEGQATSLKYIATESGLMYTKRCEGASSRFLNRNETSGSHSPVQTFRTFSYSYRQGHNVPIV